MVNTFQNLETGAVEPGKIRDGRALVEQSPAPPPLTTVTPGSPTSSVLLADAPGRLHSLRVSYTGAGTVYLQLFDAVDTDALTDPGIDTARIDIPYKLTAASPEVVIEYRYPLPFAFGCVAALSSTKYTFTATVDTAEWFGQAG